MIAKHDNPSESTGLSRPWLSFFTYLHTLHTHRQLRDGRSEYFKEAEEAM